MVTDTERPIQPGALFQRLEGAALKPRLVADRAFSAPIVAALLVLLAAGAWARLSTLGADALWADELYSWAVTRMDYGRILNVRFDIHPPLFYALLKAATTFGQGEAVLRAPSAICGLITVGLVFGFARRYCGTAPALAGACVLLFSYNHIVHSSTARNYALVVMLSVGASWALSALARRLSEGAPLRRLAPAAAAYVLLASGALLSHTLAAVYLAVLSALMLVGVGLERPARAMPLAIGIAAVNAPAYLLFALWLASLGETTADFTWLRAFTPVDALRTLVLAIAPSKTHPVVMVAAALCVFAGAYAALRRTPAVYWAPTLAMSLAMPATLYLVSFAKPMFMERTILLAVPGAALAVAALLAALRSPRLAQILSVALVAAYAASALAFVTRGKDEESYSTQNVQDFRAAIAKVDAAVGDGAALVTCETFSEPALRYYGTRKTYPQYVYLLKGRDFGVRTGRWEDRFGLPFSQRVELKWVQPRPDALAPFQRLVYMQVSTYCLDDPIRKILPSLGFTQVKSEHVQGINIRQYARPQLPPLNPVATR